MSFFLRDVSLKKKSCGHFAIDAHLYRQWSFRVNVLSPMHYAGCARMHIRRTGSGGKSDLKLPIYRANDAPFPPLHAFAYK